jgi:hypothetical protein
MDLTSTFFRRLVLPVLTVFLPLSLRAVDPPGIINHQGRVAVSGVNHDGAGYFKFALVDAAGTTTYWSNNASSVAGAAPTAAILTPVTGGHYSVPLGDTTYHANMTTAIPKEVFAQNADVRLSIWFSTDNVTFQKLSPNRRLASSAYALSSGSTGTIASGAIGSAQIATGAVNGTHLAPDSVSGDQLADGAVMTVALADKAVTGGKIADGAIMGTHLANGSVATATLSDNAITSAKLANNAVISSKIADSAITTAKLADNAVTSAKIVDGTITKADLNGSIGVWDTAAGNVYRSSGNVGIGTANPLGLFEIHGDAVTGAETVDQEVLTPAITVEVAWQSFTAGQTGKLTGIELKVGSPLATSSSAGTINLYAGEGTGGPLLGTQAVTFNVVAAGSYQSFVLTTPIDVTTGTVYTIGVSVPLTLVNWMFIDTANPYPGGRSDTAAWDLGFRTRVTPFSSSAILTVRGGNLGLGIPVPTAKLHVVGGALFTSGAGGANQTVSWSPGAASWSFTSDRNTKEDITPINPGAVLEKLTRIPIAEWNYIGYEQRHIGPMAQDFHAAFPLNGSDTSLNDADLHGVALAAIQGLNQRLEQHGDALDREKAALREENEALKKRLENLELQVGRLLAP